MKLHKYGTCGQHSFAKIKYLLNVRDTDPINVLNYTTDAVAVRHNQHIAPRF